MQQAIDAGALTARGGEAAAGGYAPAPLSVWNQDRPRREELASAAIQGSGALAGAAALAHLVTQHLNAKLDGAAAAALAVYGASLCVAFLASALYHGVRRPRARAILQRIDHCTIFLLIAGTCTPVALLPLRHHSGAALLAAVWTLALCGITLRLSSPLLYRRIALPLYAAMGWLGLAWSAALYHALGQDTLVLMVTGGLSYTAGLVLYCRQRPFSNCLWHVSVVAGSACFFAAIHSFLP